MSAFTIRQALELPIFSSTQLVAGKKGVDNPIYWVHVVDTKNAHYQWERQGVLLLTTGSGIYENSEEQAALIPKLARLGFAGLVLSTGPYFDRVPEVIRKDANRLGIPIIEAPPDLLFIQISEAILKRTVNQQYALLQQSAQINQSLTELVLQSATLSDLATRLSELLGRSVSIESPTFQILAAAQFGEIDQVWAQSIALKKSIPEVTDCLLSDRIYEQLIATSKPQILPSMPQLGMTAGRIIAPIVVDQKSYGYLWLMSQNQQLTPLDELVLTHGATVAALIMMKEQAVRNAQDTLQGDFFTQILTINSGYSSQLQEQSRRFGYRLDRDHQVLFMRYIKPSMTSISALKELIKELLNKTAYSSLLVSREDCLIAILECESSGQGKQFAKEILASVNHLACPLIIGIGTVCETFEPSSNTLRKSYEQAQEVAHIGVLLQRQGAIAFEELGLLHWLYHLPSEHLSDNFYLKPIRTLAAYDEKRGTQLLETLEAYLDQGCSVSETAKVLFIHRNTLLNRIKSLESLCDINLRNTAQRLDLSVAIKSFRLHG